MKSISLIPTERIESKIYFIRGKKVMFDSDLAKLYGVSTGRLNEQVKRNRKRFPEDFMFKLNRQEVELWKSYSLRSQFAILNAGDSRSQVATLKRGKHIKYAPSVFTEQGVAMLSSVLNSERAIQVNIQIMRTFTMIREMLASNKDLRQKIEALEKKYDKQFKVVFEAIKALMTEKSQPKQRIGFRL